MVVVRGLLLAAAIAVASVGSASAATVDYFFTGHVTTGLGDVAAGDVFSGKFTIKSTTPFRVGAPPPNAVYDAIKHFEFSVFSNSAGKSFAGSYTPLDGVEVQVESGAGPDRYFVRAPSSVSGDAVDGKSLLGFDFFLADFVNNVLNNSDLVQDLVTLLPFFPDRVFTAHYLNDRGEALWNGQIDTLTQTPLPAALPLFATVLAGSGLIAWRRKRRIRPHRRGLIDPSCLVQPRPTGSHPMATALAPHARAFR